MGGNAFQNLHPEALFPRLPPALYQALRAQLFQRLEVCYRWLETPAEAPEKKDHGDIDFVVAEPKLLDRPDGNGRAASYDDVKDILGATWLIPSEDNRTSNFAINITSDWNKIQNEESRSEVYCQVDVHVCSDKDEWGRIVFFHGYGDLGMIIGLIARNCGLHLGTKGLKVPMPHGNPPFHLSSSFESILPFLGFSMERWKEGFKTDEAAFKWATTSRFFHPATLQDKENRSKRKEKGKRQMYNNFTTWVECQLFDDEAPNWTPETVVQEGLDYFGKREEYDAVMNEYERLETVHAARRRVKATFNGTLITEWTGLRGFDVKRVMDKVRERTGGEEAMDGMSVEEVEGLVKQAAKELDSGGGDELAEQLERTSIVNS